MTLLEVFFTFLRLGLTSFGGPIAHLSYFHDEFVKKKKWIEEHSFADLVALCQFLPGPASSQLGIAIGLNQSGFLGALVAWIGFTLPSAILLIMFGMGMTHFNLQSHQNVLHGLKVAAVSVVAQAVYGMWKKLCPDKTRSLMAIASCACLLFFTAPFVPLIVLIVAGVFGAFFFQSTSQLPHLPFKEKFGRKLGASCLIIFFSILLVSPFLRSVYQAPFLMLFDSFFRAGSLVFGGGHVVLPLLQAEVVTPGWVSKDLFMAGYGLAQAIPGPLFAFTAYLGTVSSLSFNGWSGGLFCLSAAFLPSFLLIAGVLPFWEKLRTYDRMRKVLLGINASVVGILLAAFFHPVCSSAIFNLKDFLVALIGFILLEKWKAPSWGVVMLSALISLIIF
ncbi:chromate transporter [Bacteriovorax stolpii]|uniref:Chromate transporter n=1 Tax=Bacteriovorax stolpii TaxID=960 RepID=A0A2K9NVL9_BACTC|nr:chromate efflux transporter [Bacteriovorax stolpii]AUN99105.1 chromate transporter [Bacteriovorax stolpii]TDP55363.1 chromate transporter [Bacteriovorax stolpii]